MYFIGQNLMKYNIQTGLILNSIIQDNKFQDIIQNTKNNKAYYFNKKL